MPGEGDRNIEVQSYRRILVVHTHELQLKSVMDMRPLIPGLLWIFIGH